jgi:DNA-binding MarR family transcriptional regulator
VFGNQLEERGRMATTASYAGHAGHAAHAGHASDAAMPERGRVTGLLRRVRELNLTWREVTRASFPTGMSGLAVLTLAEQRGDLRVSDLAACAHVGVSTMSRHVTELTTAGLLERVHGPGDGRTHMVRLTDKGRAEIEQARATITARLAPLLDGWTKHDVDHLAGQLERLIRDLAATGGTPERTP